MASAKTATLTFRIEPEVKGAVRIASVNEHRSIASRTAVMIRDYCGRAGVEIAEPNNAPGKKTKRVQRPQEPAARPNRKRHVQPVL